MDKPTERLTLEPMNISSQELSALTLIASGVPSVKVESVHPIQLGSDASLVKDFLLNSSRPATTPAEVEARDTALGINQWFLRQLAESEQWRSSRELSSRSDYNQLMASE